MARPDGLIGGTIDLSKVSDPNTLALLYEFRWSPAGDPDIAATKISYAFPLAVSDFASTPASFSPATPAQRSATETAFHLISSYTQLSAVELPSDQAVNQTILKHHGCKVVRLEKRLPEIAGAYFAIPFQTSGKLKETGHL